MKNTFLIILAALLVGCQTPGGKPDPLVDQLTLIGVNYAVASNPKYAPYVPATVALLDQTLTPERFNEEVDAIVALNPPKEEDAADVAAVVALIKLAYSQYRGGAK